MTKEVYEKISRPFRNKQSVVNAVNKALTLTVYISYPLLLIYLALLKREKLLECVLVPAVMLVAVSILRRLINRPRPYEKLEIEPLIKKDKKGSSMPSRHIFSTFMIAMTFLYVSPLLSVPLFLIGVLLGIIRVIGGVHYPSDIIVGALIGIVSGAIGFFVI